MPREPENTTAGKEMAAVKAANLLNRRSWNYCKKIAEGSPYFDGFDEVIGHCDSINPSKMAIERSSTFTSELSVNNTSQNGSESEPADDVAEVQESSVKRKAEKKICRRKVSTKAKEGGEMSPKVPLKTGRVLLWKCGNRVWNRTTQDLNVRRKYSF